MRKALVPTLSSALFLCLFALSGCADDGAAGLASLMAIVDEAPGTNCLNGGKRVDAGLDANENGTLDAAEIANTAFVCNGVDGETGVDCWDLDEDGSCSLADEDTNQDGTCDVDDCYPYNPQPYECWDTNQNGFCDLPAEDFNNDGACTIYDCMPRGEDGISCWDLSEDRNCDVAEDVNDDGVCTVLDCSGSTDLADRITQLETDLARLTNFAPFAWDGAGSLLGLVAQITTSYYDFYDVVSEAKVRVVSTDDKYFYFVGNGCSGERWVNGSDAALPGIYSHGFLDQSNGDICVIPGVTQTSFEAASRRKMFDSTGAYACEPTTEIELRRPCSLSRSVTMDVVVAPGP